jgi:hypothetical protein
MRIAKDDIYISKFLMLKVAQGLLKYEIAEDIHM